MLSQKIRNLFAFIDQTLASLVWVFSVSKTIVKSKILLKISSGFFAILFFIFFSYNSTLAWTCGSSLVDTRDSQSYSTVQIGSQCWMKQNLNIGTYTSGTSGSNIGCSSSDGSDITKYCYADDTGNCTTYGGLYQWNQTMCGSTIAGAQGICPTGWHVPTHDEFTTLERAVCTSGTCATDFPYDTSTTGSRGSNEGTTLKTNDSSHFSTLLSGILVYPYEAYFDGLSSYTYLWTSTYAPGDWGPPYAWYRQIDTGSTITRNQFDIWGISAGSLRCVRDNVVTVSQATNIASTSATLNGSVINVTGGNPNITIYWGDNDGGTTTANWDHVVSLGTTSAGTFNSNITGLVHGTTYYFTAKAVNSDGTSWAPSSQSFRYYSNADVTGSITSLYHFNNNFNDASSYGNNGTGFGNTSFSTAKLGSHSASFDGDGDYVSLSNLPVSGSQSFTISVWVNSTSYTWSRRNIIDFGKTTTGQGAWLYINESDRLAFDLTNTTGPVSSVSVSDGTWHLATVVNNAGVFQLYVDGVASGAPVSMSSNIQTGSQNIGKSLNDYVDNLWYFYGSLDELSVWNRALATEEIRTIYNSGNGLEMVPLKISTDYASNISSSGANLNGTLTSDAGASTTVTIYWGDNDGGTTAANWDNTVSLGVVNVGSFYTSLSGLTYGTTYYYRIKGNNGSGDTWSAASKSFVPGCSGIGGSATVFNGSCLHTFTSSDTFTSPVGGLVTKVFAWGAGGAGGSLGDWGYGSAGGAGGAARGIASLSAGSYPIIVGGGGVVNSAVGSVGGGGAASNNNSDNRYSGGGGGYSGIFSSSISQANAVLIAGGGGGGGSSRSGTGNYGGAGGGSVGQDGNSPYDLKSTYAGKGGTQTAAGADASSDGANASGGQGALQGGMPRTNSYGGGGGGGYWGGSAGGYSESNTMAGGGGGSGYYKTSVVSSAVLTSGNYNTPGDVTNILRGTAGNAGGSITAGTNGLVLVSYPLSGLVTTPVITLNSATSVAATSAVISGDITSTGNEDPLVTIYYGTVDGGTTASSWANSVSLGTTTWSFFSTTLTGLTSGTRYYYRAKATNSAGTTWASTTQNFKYYTDGELAASLAGYWQMNNNWLDSSGNNNNGTAYGNTTFASGKVGQAGSFDGNSDYVSIPDSANYAFGTSSFSISFWINFSSIQNTLIYRQSADSNNFFQFYFETSNGLIFYSKSGGTNQLVFYVPWSPSTSTWYNVTLVRDGNSWSVLVNGTAQTLSLQAGSYSNSQPDISAPLIFGNDSSSYDINGLLDDVMIYRRALSSSEISALYNSGSGRELTISNVTAPSLTVTPATNIASTTATLNGTLSSDGNASTTVTVYWGTTDGGTTTANWTNAVSLGTTTSSSTFSTNLTGLTAGTTYYFRAKAVNSAGTTWASSTQNFKYYTDTELSSGLVGYWKMNNNWLDSSGNNNTGTAYNGATFSTTTANTKLGSTAGYFDGSDDYVDVANESNFDLTAFTFSAWVNAFDTPPTNNWRSIVTKGDDGPFTIATMSSASCGSGGEFGAGMNDGSFENVCSGIVPTPNTWYHVVVTDTGTTRIIYINGVNRGTITHGTAHQNNYNLRLGTNGATGGRYWKGIIDDAIIYNRALSSSEISALYNAGSGRELPGISAPTLTLNSVTNVAISTATLSGNLTSAGGTSTVVTLYWGTTDGGTTTANWTNSMTALTSSVANTFSKNISGLLANTKYYFTAKAANFAGTTWTSTQNFTTTQSGTPILQIKGGVKVKGALKIKSN